MKIPNCVPTRGQRSRRENAKQEGHSRGYSVNTMARQFFKHLACISLLVLSLTAICPYVLVNAAHSRRRVVVRTVASTPRYDRSITTFDPSGRLLQVEYALQAAGRGSSVLVAMGEKKSSIFIVVCGSNQQSSQPSDSSSSSTEGVVNDISLNKVFRIDDHLWMVTCGLVGDARTLAAQLRISCQRHRLAYGEAPRVEEAAQEAASLQHQLTRTGGARPLGCTAIIVGIDDCNPVSEAFEEELSVDASEGCRRNGFPQIFRTDPGGIMEDCLYYAMGKEREKILSALENAYEVDGLEAISNANPSSVAHRLAKIMGEASGENSIIDLWFIRSDEKCRGKMKTMLFSNVRCDKQNEKLFSYLTGNKDPRQEN